MIGQHPQMYGLPEVNLFAADDYKGLNRLYQLRPGFRHGLLRAVAELGLSKQTEDNIRVARKWLEENAETISAALYRDLADWADPRRLVDKSPIYVFSPSNLQRIKRAFPDAYYIHLVRHPRDTCESILKLRGMVEEGMEKIKLGDQAKAIMKNRYQKIAQIDDPDSLWLKPHLNIAEFLETIPPSRQMFVHGETFMADPKEFLKDICLWLGIDAGTEAIEAMHHPENSPFACMGPKNARLGNDPSYLEDPPLREYKARQSSLDGALDGFPDIFLSDDVKQCARIWGYN